MRSAGSEEELTFLLARYLRLRHPSVLFHFDFGSGAKLTKASAGKQKALNGRSWPDLLIAKPTMFDGTVNPCAGLFLELKRDGTRLKKKNGRWASVHIEEQAAVLDALQDQGYYATFAVGLDQAIEHIEAYLGQGLPADDGAPF